MYLALALHLIDSKHESYKDLYRRYRVKTNRKFHSIRITGLYFHDHGDIKIFIRLGSKVKKQVTDDVQVKSFGLFTAISKLMPNLDHVALKGTTIDRVPDLYRKSVVPELSKLKTLAILKRITRAQLNNIGIISYYIAGLRFCEFGKVCMALDCKCLPFYGDTEQCDSDDEKDRSNNIDFD